MNDAELCVLETDFWSAYVMPDQRYLGRLVVVLNQPCGDLAWLDSQQWQSFHRVVQVLEGALRKAFDATMFNWCCLMNNAYQESSPEPQVHWHFRPRYNHSVEFAGRVFVDPNFGHHYLREDTDKLVMDREFLVKLATKLRNNIRMVIA